MDLGVEKNEGGLAEKIPSSYQTKKNFSQQKDDASC
jgi:hypothetical protein